MLYASDPMQHFATVGEPCAPLGPSGESVSVLRGGACGAFAMVKSSEGHFLVCPLAGHLLPVRVRPSRGQRQAGGTDGSGWVLGVEADAHPSWDQHPLAG